MGFYGPPTADEILLAAGGYHCDICGRVVPAGTKKRGLDRNRVLTSPVYWERLVCMTDSERLAGTFVLATGSPVEATLRGKLYSEKMLEVFLKTSCKGPRTGYIACDGCYDDISTDHDKATRYGIEECVRSIPSGRVDKPSVRLVAGTVWEEVHGSWPASFKVKTKRRQGASASGKKWWQFWTSRKGGTGGGTLRTDGLYKSGTDGSGSWDYLRFYSDGAVLNVASTGNELQVARWFCKSEPAVESRGRYTLNGSTIRFSTRASYGRIDYEGTVAPDMIRLTVFSRITGSRSNTDYHFVSVPGIAG